MGSWCEPFIGSKHGRAGKLYMAHSVVIKFIVREAVDVLQRKIRRAGKDVEFIVTVYV